MKLHDTNKYIYQTSFFRNTSFPNELHNKLQETREENQELKNQIKEKENEIEL